jgi:hypothetical protein
VCVCVYRTPSLVRQRAHQCPTQHGPRRASPQQQTAPKRYTRPRPLHLFIHNIYTCLMYIFINLYIMFIFMYLFIRQAVTPSVTPSVAPSGTPFRACASRASHSQTNLPSTVRVSCGYHASRVRLELSFSVNPKLNPCHNSARSCGYHEIPRLFGA